MAGLGTPGSGVAIGTRAKPGSLKPSSAPNAVLTAPRRVTAKPSISARPMIRPVKPKPRPGLHGAAGLTGGTNKPGLTTKPKPVIPSGDVIDQQQIRNLYHEMMYGNGQDWMGLSGLMNQQSAIAKDNYGQFHTKATEENNAFRTSLDDWNAQAAAGGMLNSGGRITNANREGDIHTQAIKDIDQQYGAGASANLVTQYNQMQAQYMKQILALLGEKNASNLASIVGGA